MEIANIRIIETSITLLELQQIASERFGDMVKGVVDIERQIMALGGEMHADEEAVLLERGSKQDNLWGVNLYVDTPFPEMVEFDSMINIRPRQGNRSRGVEKEEIRTKILAVVQRLVL